jgi:hypothetical protein
MVCQVKRWRAAPPTAAGRPFIFRFDPRGKQGYVGSGPNNSTMMENPHVPSHSEKKQNPHQPRKG